MKNRFNIFMLCMKNIMFCGSWKWNIYFIFMFYKYKFHIHNSFMATFTSTLPDDLLKLLSEKAQALSLPKNRLIENALRIYLEHLEKAEYVRSYQQASADADLLHMAEEGMADYYKQLEK